MDTHRSQTMLRNRRKSQVAVADNRKRRSVCGMYRREFLSVDDDHLHVTNIVIMKGFVQIYHGVIRRKGARTNPRPLNITAIKD